MPMNDTENVLDIARLRQELKNWEKTFLIVNDGRKPGRDDIKKDATIAAKYKEYDRLRRPSDKLQSPKSESSRKHVEHRILRERAPNASSATPKRTPSKRKVSTSNASILSPVREVESTPAFIRCALGPTPQKDGQILGIFDALPAGTPSRPKSLAPEPMLAAVTVPGTPSKSVASSDAMLSRTPQSNSKRLYLDAFVGTPLKRKREEEKECPNTDKRKYATPSFLKRSFPMSTIDEDVAEADVFAPPFKKRSLVRSLSSIIQGLRKQEEQRMEDEWDILNEIEEEERNPGSTKSKSHITIGDGQPMEMPLGPDNIQDSGDDPSDAEGQETSRKPWKKKGLKRQTRRVIMRPIVHQPKKAEDITVEEESESETSKKAFTVGQDSKNDSDAPANAYDSDSKDDRHVAANRYERDPQKVSSPAKMATGKQKNVIEKGVRKISAQAHANFRKLKIKNKNSKSNGRHRFGRR